MAKARGLRRSRATVIVDDPRLVEPTLLDPNGEIRGEPRRQPLAGALERYEETREWLVYGPDAHPRREAAYHPEVARALELLDAGIV
jgi:hypothetical protein